MINVSVPGKIHLLGEHSVVYGKPALLSSINLKVTLTLTPLKRHSGKQSASRISLLSSSNLIGGSINNNNLMDSRRSLPRTPIRGGNDRKRGNDKKVAKLLNILEHEISIKFSIKQIPSYSIKLQSELPIGSGLGSSAAISVALTKGLLKYLKLKASKKQIFDIALEGEKFFHGNPSGGDIAACLYQGLIWFKKESELIKTITPLIFPIHKNIKPFVLIDSGKPVESTKEMVELVRVKGKALRGKLKEILNEQEELTKKIAEVLQNGDEALLIKTIRKGEKNLEKLGVVGKIAQKIIRKVEKLGGASKIMGGGGFKAGSGMLLSYHKDPKVILNFAKANSLDAILINI